MKRAGQEIDELSLKSMNVKRFSSMVVLFALPRLLCLAGPGPGPNYNNRQPVYEDPIAILKQVRVSVSDLKHELRNHESEIRLFEEKLHNQELQLESVKQEVTDGIQSQKDFSKANVINLEGQIQNLNSKLESLDNTLKSLIVDMRQIKTQSNDSVYVLSQYKQKLVELESVTEAQTQHMKNLELAMNSIMEVLQAREAAEKAAMAINRTSASSKSYKVQSGDSLEKIARRHDISVQALKEANQLSSDQIMINQTLKIPEKK